MSERGTVLNLQRFSVHDGPGVRTTVFLKGCPLRCSWCHNPESRSPSPQLLILAARCLRCGACAEVCPTGAASGEGTCEACGRCAEACPSGARELAGRGMDPGEVLEEILRDRLFYEESGGGATFSGGEPLAQPRFLLACLAACRHEGISTALDTCGLSPPEVLLEAAALSDLVLFDLKAVDPAVHERHTGVSNLPILENLRRLAAVHPAVWLRIPVIPGVNDGEEEVRGAAALARSLPGVRRVCLLPYHALGEEKAGRLGLARSFGPAASPPPETLARVAAPFERAGIAVQIGG